MGNSSPVTEKLINLDTTSPTTRGPPPPPPRTTSDPHYNKNENNENNNDTSIPVSVTYFSSGLNGHGLERETIFADDHAATDAASIVRQHLNPFSVTGSSKNPFLDSNGQVPAENSSDDKDKSLDDLVEQKIQDLINANPFNSNGSKFNTIGRSNPFSNKNPFLNGSGTTTDSSKIAATSSGEDVNDSPDSSLEPDHEVHNSIDTVHSTLTNINKIETSFASNQPVTRSLSSVTSNNKSKLPMAVVNTVNNQNRINNAKKTSNSNDLEQISPWLVSTEAITTKKEKEKSKIPQLKTVITTELWEDEEANSNHYIQELITFVTVP